MLLGTSGLLRSLSHLCKFFFSNRAFFFASPTANATFAAAVCYFSGAFFGYLGAPYFAIAQYGLLAPPISPVGLNTASRRGYVLVSLRAYAALSSRGCASLTPGCVLAPFQGARCVDDCLPGVALRLPRAVFWRPFRAYVSGTPSGVMMDWGRHSPGVAGGYSREPLAGFNFPTPNHQRPRLRASIAPRERSHICRRQMSIDPRQICHICRRRMSIPPRHICHVCRRQMSIPPRHLWRGGGRQAGGEVKFPHAKSPTPAYAGVHCPSPNISHLP